MSTIITRNSATSGSVPSSLVQGELAINVTNGRLFYGSGSGNTVKEFGVTSSYALNALSASYAQTASYALTSVTPSLQQVVNTGNSLVNFGGIGTASLLSVNFVNNRSLYLNNDSYPTIRLVDNINASNNLQIDIDTISLDGVSYNWSDIVNSTASYALQALSASYAETASYAPAYLPLTGGTINGNVTVNGTASIAFLNVTYESASVIYSSGSNQFGDASNDTQTLWGTVDIKSGPVLVTGSVIANSFTGSLLGTASYATQALSASYAQTASYVQNSQTASYVLSASYALTASYVENAQTASYVTLAQTASYVQTAQTASYVLNAVSASFATLAQTANTASYVENAQTASYVLQAVSASYATTASYSNTSTSASYAITASYALNALSASYAVNGGVTQLLAGPNITLSPTTGKGQVTISATLSGSTIFNTATGSYGSFYDTTTQTNPVGNVPRSMSFNTTDISNGVSISGSTSPFNTYIKTENPGVYDIQFSAQLDKTDSGTDEVVIWLRKNGSDLTDTATTITLTNNNTKYVAAWNWFVNSAANDYYQIIWYSADTDLRLLAETAGGGHPGIPSVILTVNRVDQFLSNTGSFSGSFTGNLIGTASYATQALSASYATTASYSNTSTSASFATTATTSTTASYVTLAQTASYALQSVSSSFATTASYVSSNFQYEIHVSQIDGNDTTGDGSLLKPVATVTKALTLLGASRKTIIIHPGTYSENVTVADTNTTISTSELTGANTLLSGTLTIGTLGSGTRISGLKMTNLVISGTAQAYISNCTVDNQVTKSSSGYVEIINSEMQCISGIQISGAGTTIINGNKNVGIAVSNASAQVIIKGCNSVVTPSASAGNLAIVDSIVTALGGNGITITGASTTLTLANSQVLVQAGNNVAPISVAGIYSIYNTVYDKPGSTFTGTSTNSVDYFQYINADNITTQGLIVTGSILTTGSITLVGNQTITGSLTATSFTGSLFGTASWASNAVTAQTASYVLNAVSASFATLAQTSNTASYVVTAQTASYVLNAVSASYATQALSASYAPSTPTFPYTGSAIISGSLTVTGSLYITGSATLINEGPTVLSGSFKVQGAGNGFVGPFAAIEIDDVNFSRKLFDFDTGSGSLDFSARQLLDRYGTTAIEWTGTSGTYISNLYGAHRISSGVRDKLYTNNDYSGQILLDVYFDINVQDNDLVYLGNSGEWIPAEQSNAAATKMLGIAKEIFNQTGSVLIEGDLVVTTTGGYPIVSNAGYGSPVYMKEGAGTQMDTTIPVNGYVRLLGYCYASYNAGNDWIMKFRPSNEWVEL